MFLTCAANAPRQRPCFQDWHHTETSLCARRACWPCLPKLKLRHRPWRWRCAGASAGFFAGASAGSSAGAAADFAGAASDLAGAASDLAGAAADFAGAAADPAGGGAPDPSDTAPGAPAPAPNPAVGPAAFAASPGARVVACGRALGCMSKLACSAAQESATSL